MSEETTTKVLLGGEFLIKDSDPQSVFIPEEINEEQKMMVETAGDFVKNEILPKLDAIDNQEPGLTVKLMEQAGELGLLGASVPEEYGGIGGDFNTNTVLAMEIGKSHSFGVSFAAHTGIGTLPILYYGTKEQKDKYLPKLASGEMKSAYCLTEPTSGSDALAAKTTAVLSADGKYYTLNGQKMWITNGGFADFYTVFAKIDDDDTLSAFLVESSWEGISLNPEEHKMGIKGSSTRQIFFNNVKVPVEN